MSQEGIARRGGELFLDEGVDGFIHRAFMRGRGLGAEEVRRGPVIGICTSWSELNPCNAGLDGIAEAVRRGVLTAGGLPFVMPSMSISEPYTRPTSMLLRNLMAMEVEQQIVSSPIDAVVLLGGCDKTVPAQLMAAVSADKPALLVTAGPRPTACLHGKPFTTDDLWPLAERRRQGRLDARSWDDLEGLINPGVGTCNVMGTAITMAAVAEILGFALPGSALPVAGGSRRAQYGEEAGRRIVTLAREGPTAAELITPESVRNAFVTVGALSGSTNAILHLVAVAGRAGIQVTARQLARWTSSAPPIADVRPAGAHLLADLETEGGVPAVVRELGDLFDLTCPTADGRPWGETLPAPAAAPRALRRPASSLGAISLLSGTLAPDGAVIKRAAASPRLLRHTGPAVVFDGVADLHARIDDRSLGATADSVLILRGVGPRGGPGMPEVGHLPIPRYLLDDGITDMVRISDGRMSGTATGTVVLHVGPEADLGGPLALVRDGDLVRLDVPSGRLDLLVAASELRARAPSRPRAVPDRGYELLYRRHVLPASRGCDFDFLTR